MALKELAERLYPVFLANFTEKKPCKLFLSASTLKERAIIRHAVADVPEKAWQEAINSLEKAFNAEQPVILRADWVTSTKNMDWSEYLLMLKKRKRGWFRHGLAVDKHYKLAFTEQELNSNAILYNLGVEDTKCEFQTKRAEIYCRERFKKGFPRLTRKDKVEIFNTSAVFIQEGMDEPLKLVGKGDIVDRRELDKDNPQLFIDMAKAAAKYLANQVDSDGLFIYGYYPRKDEIIEGYNIHRHLGSLFAMAEVYSISNDGDDKTFLGAAIERGLEYALRNYVVYKKTPEGDDIAYFNDGKRMTLGMNGLALLAFTKWTTATGTKKYIPLMNSIARSIFSLQKSDGTFIHSLNIKDFTVRKDFAVPFYDGEAIYGMLRLYAITKDPEIIESCGRILDNFIETEYWKNYDHWLAYAANEFTLYRPEEKYFELGLNNMLPYMPKMVNAYANSPIRLEQIMATTKMIARMKSLPAMKKLLERVDEENFYSTVKFRADQLLDAYFFPEVAMYFKNPSHILDSFFVRDDCFRVRIDDVQHTISGFLNYAAYLKGEFNDNDVANVEEPVKEIPSPIIEVKPVERQDNSMLQVGVMKKNNRNFWEISNSRYPMFCMAKHFNIELLLFEPEDIDFESMTVKALTLENNSKVEKVAPLPRIIDNDISYFRGDTADIMDKLRHYSCLIRPVSGIKRQAFYETLSKGGRFKDFLIETQPVNNFNDLLPLLDKFDDDLILKPTSGSLVARINFNSGKYIATFNNQTTTLKTANALLKFYEANFSKKTYLAQPYCISRTRQGNPFTIRLHSRRGAEGKVNVFAYPQIGKVSELIPSSYYTVDFEDFLKDEFGKSWKTLADNLLNLGDLFPDYYQSFLSDTLFDIAIDVCVQKVGDTFYLKIFDAYLQPGFANIRNEVAVTNFEYYRYLADKLQ